MIQTLVTGPSGFIGKNLINKLLSLGTYDVSVLSRRNNNIDKRIRLFKGDIIEYSSLIEAFKGCDLIFHCAGYISFNRKEFKKLYRINVTGTKNVLEAAYKAQVNKIVILSACSVLGFSKRKNLVIDETSYPKISKDNAYTYSKFIAEKIAKQYSQKNLHVSIANISTVYGPGDEKLNSGSIIKFIYKNYLKFSPPGGTSFVSVEDLVDGLIRLSKNGKNGERYIFCSENFEYKNMIARIAKTIGVRGPKYAVPRFTYYPALLIAKLFEAISRPDLYKVPLLSSHIIRELYGYKYFSSEKAKKELGWNPTQHFEATVEQAFQYYKKNKLF